MDLRPHYRKDIDDVDTTCVPNCDECSRDRRLSSPAQYMQAAFRAQNSRTFERGGTVFQKQNAYIFDFAPERTLTIFDAFANNLTPNPSGDAGVRQENIRRLLNFFPVLGEDSEGRMIKLDASQVLTFPQVFKAREVARRGFLSNLLFTNVAGIFRYSEHVKEILEKLPKAKEGRVTTGQTIGKVGVTGNTTGPHLHLEIRRDGTPIDPAAWLTGKGAL